MVLRYRSQYVPLRRTPEPLRQRFSIDISYTLISNSFKWTGRGSPVIDADGTQFFGKSICQAGLCTASFATALTFLVLPCLIPLLSGYIYMYSSSEVLSCVDPSGRVRWFADLTKGSTSKWVPYALTSSRYSSAHTLVVN
jgi:hypothetical protein